MIQNVILLSVNINSKHQIYFLNIIRIFYQVTKINIAIITMPIKKFCFNVHHTSLLFVWLYFDHIRLPCYKFIFPQL